MKSHVRRQELPKELKLRTLPVIRKLRKRKRRMDQVAYEMSLIKDARDGNFIKSNLTRTVLRKHRQTLNNSIQGPCLAIAL